MAKIISPIVSAASGTVGGGVYQRGRDGQHLRARTHTRQPRTPAQLSQRDTLRNISQVWQQLDDPTRAAWSSLAAQQSRQDALGQHIPMSGFDLFVAYAVPQQLYIGFSFSSPPDTFPPNPMPAVTDCTFLISDPIYTSNVFLNCTNLDPNGNYVVWNSKPLSPGQSNFNRVTWHSTGSYGAISDTQIGVGFDFSAPSFYPVLGQRIAFKVVNLPLEGLMSQPQYTSCIVE